MYLFVYGTLKRGFRNNRLLNEFSYLGDAWAEGYVLHSVGSFPAMVPGDGTVQGELYSIEGGRYQPWASLDRLEGVPHMYRREEVWCTLRLNNEDQDLVQAQTYLWNQPTAGLKLIESGVWN